MSLPVREHITKTGKAKKGYGSWKEAWEMARQQQERNGSNRRPYHAYMCVCGEWHIGRKRAK